MNDVESQLIGLTKQLLDAIFAGDWETYAQLCDPSITSIEPEGRGHLIKGLPFHQFYFNLGGGGGSERPVNVTISSPHVRIMGDAAVVAYVRLVQVVDPLGEPQTRTSEETRVWQRIAGEWKHVHFHRSPIA